MRLGTNGLWLGGWDERSVAAERWYCTNTSELHFVGGANEIAATFIARREAWKEGQLSDLRVDAQVLDYA
jgi:hypothetical protein